jgi:acyl-CoA reductase-like NAD-dependent aldehyde dehydrogenase
MDKGKIVIGGEVDKSNLYIAPTIIDEVDWEDPIMQEEIFGPILPIMEYNNLNEVIDTINSHPKPLALYLFSDNKEVQQKIIEKTSSGGVCINAPTYHQVSSLLPFGGVGDSGMGNYHGKFSFGTFSHKKAVVIKSFFPDLKIVYPPYKGKLRLLRKIWG